MFIPVAYFLSTSRTWYPLMVSLLPWKEHNPVQCLKVTFISVVDLLLCLLCHPRRASVNIQHEILYIFHGAHSQVQGYLQRFLVFQTCIEIYTSMFLFHLLILPCCSSSIVQDRTKPTEAHGYPLSRGHQVQPRAPCTLFFYWQ
jgi:hypothetical protein